MESQGEMLQGKSNSLEGKLSAVQDRYEIRFKAQEDEIKKMRKEYTTYKHENELLKVELSDHQFRVTRSEHNEKILQERLARTIEDYAGLLSKIEVYDNKNESLRKEILVVTSEKNDAEDLVEKKRLKLKISEDRVHYLENELKDKTAENHNRVRAYDRMKRENDEWKKKTGNNNCLFLDESERKLQKVKNDTVKRLRHTVVTKEQDIKIYKQKVKGSEIQIQSKTKEIKFLHK